MNEYQVFLNKRFSLQLMSVVKQFYFFALEDVLNEVLLLSNLRSCVLVTEFLTQANLSQYELYLSQVYVR